jgi:protein-S-isoprenylcysteine O-methyltransferase Ste14
LALLDLNNGGIFTGNWLGVLGWIIVFATFLVFLPYNRKSGSKPKSVYLAFIIASALEMFGIPLSMYFIAWAFGLKLPRGLLWGHTLQGYIGYWGMYIGFGLNLVGAALIILGWKAVHSSYWSAEEENKRLVTEGVYAYSRHPQYLGFILMTLGLLVHWATIPLLVMWPLLVFQYYRLAQREEAEMVEEFGDEYVAYRDRVPMFLPRPGTLFANETWKSATKAYIKSIWNH